MAAPCLCESNSVRLGKCPFERPFWPFVRRNWFGPKTGRLRVAQQTAVGVVKSTADYGAGSLAIAVALARIDTSPYPAPTEAGA